MERNAQRSAVINLLVLLAGTIAAFAVSRYAGSLAGQVGSAFIALGFLAAVVSWFQMRLEERERLEKLEFEEVTRAGGSATLFNTQESETFPAQRSREQFERFFVPGFSIFLLILQGAGTWFLFQWVRTSSVAIHNSFIAISLLGIFALVFFLLGKYSANLARLEKERLLRPSAGYLLLSAYVLAIVIAGIAAYEADFPRVDYGVALGLCVLLALLAVENILTLILEIYRPRVKGKPERVLYESRLVALLGHPEGIFTTAAHALDYQFGFKVSETWGYKFLEKRLGWLILAQSAILLFSTCFVFINAGEEALLERFGKPVASRQILEPGFHLKLPWPIDRAHRFRTQEIRSFNIGFVHEEKPEDQGGKEHEVILWTVSHYKEEFNLLVASREGVADTNAPPDATRRSPPVNLLSVSIPVQYQITNLHAWAYNHSDPDKLLEAIGTREVVRYLVSADLNELMSSGRFQASEELRRRIQEQANQLQLGVQLVFLGLQDVHPPVAVAQSYEEAVGALQKREANLLAAQAHKIQTNALAEAEGFRIKSAAEAARKRVVSTKLAEAANFTNQIPAYKAAPAVYTMRSYLATLGRAGAESRKVIIASTNRQEVYQLNLEDKLDSALLENLAVPTAAPRK